MITSDLELSVTREKLADLQRHAKRLEDHGEPQAEAARLTLQSYNRLIHRLEEEIQRYETGTSPPALAKDAIQSNEQLVVAQSKLDELLTRLEEVEQESQSPARDEALTSLRRIRNRLQEEIAWFKARAAQPVNS